MTDDLFTVLSWVALVAVAAGVGILRLVGVI